MHEFDKQVAITLNKTANIIESLFPAQLFNLCEDEQFELKFDCSVAEPLAGRLPCSQLSCLNFVRMNSLN